MNDNKERDSKNMEIRNKYLTDKMDADNVKNAYDAYVKAIYDNCVKDMACTNIISTELRMIWVEETEQWFYLKKDDVFNIKTKEGYVVYDICAINGILTIDTYKRTNVGLFLKECYDMELWEK